MRSSCCVLGLEIVHVLLLNSLCVRLSEKDGVAYRARAYLLKRLCCLSFAVRPFEQFSI